MSAGVRVCVCMGGGGGGYVYACACVHVCARACVCVCVSFPCTHSNIFTFPIKRLGTEQTAHGHWTWLMSQGNTIRCFPELYYTPLTPSLVLCQHLSPGRDLCISPGLITASSPTRDTTLTVLSLVPLTAVRPQTELRSFQQRLV